MFYDCSNAQLKIEKLPETLKTAFYMFYYCLKAEFLMETLPSKLENGAFMFYRCDFSTFPNLKELSNSLTNIMGMFNTCSYARLTITNLPSALQYGNYAFSYCKNMTFNLSSLPSTMSNCKNMFSNCSNENNKFNLEKLPNLITSIEGMFNNCGNSEIKITAFPSSIVYVNDAFYNAYKTIINLDEIALNAPENGFEKLQKIDNLFTNAGSGNSPGTVTGSKSAFLAKCPNVSSMISAFIGTNTTD